MFKAILLSTLIAAVIADSCVYDIANFQEVYTILKTKQVQSLTQTTNGQVSTQMQIFTDPAATTVAVDSYTSSRVSLLFVPLQVIDITSDLQSDPKALLTEDNIKSWEKKYGKIPSDSIVLVRTNNPTAVFNGWEDDALEFLFEGRNVTGIGHDQLTDTIPDKDKKYLYNSIYITQTGNLASNSDYGNLVQIRKLSSISANQWSVDIQSVIPQSVCSAPKRLVNQWWSVILILAFLLGVIYLIWYCCLKRFDKYNKEEFKPMEWDTRNQEGIYYNKDELTIPLAEMNKSQEQKQ